MKLNLRITSNITCADTLDVSVADDKIIWTQLTGANVTYAAAAAAAIMRTFPDYKLETFAFNPTEDRKTNEIYLELIRK